MKYIKPYLLLLPQIFVGIIFLVGIGIGITQSFGVVPVFNLYKPTFRYYTEIFMRFNLLQFEDSFCIFGDICVPWDPDMLLYGIYGKRQGTDA